MNVLVDGAEERATAYKELNVVIQVVVRLLAQVAEERERGVLLKENAQVDTAGVAQLIIVEVVLKHVMQVPVLALHHLLVELQEFVMVAQVQPAAISHSVQTFITDHHSVTIVHQACVIPVPADHVKLDPLHVIATAPEIL
jgi:hypothetical protein